MGASQYGRIDEALTFDADMRYTAELLEIFTEHRSVRVGEYALLFVLEEEPDKTSDPSRCSWLASIINFAYVDDTNVGRSAGGLIVPHQNRPFRSYPQFAEIDAIELRWTDIRPDFDPTPYLFGN